MPRLAPPPSLEEAVTQYLAALAGRGRRATTIAAYRGELRRFRRHAESRAGTTSVGDIGGVLVDTYQRSLSPGNPGGRPRSRPLGQAAADRSLVVLRGFLTYAWRCGWLAEDLASRVQLGRVLERPPNPMTGGDLQRLVAALAGTSLKDRRDRALVLLLLSSGARVSELLRLNQDDWSHNRLILRGKGGRKRTAVVTARARKAVEEYLRVRERIGDTSTALFVGFQPALTKASSNRLSTVGARHILHAISQRAGIPPFHALRLRDTFGSIVFRETGDLSFAASSLGYADVRSVAGYLPKPDDKRRLARKALEATGL